MTPRSGKDTLAKALTDDGWARLAFADELKRDLLRIVGSAMCDNPPSCEWDVSELAPYFDGEKKVVMRPLMVEYGRTLRAIDPGHWIRRAQVSLARKIDTAGPALQGVVITDLRYADEAEWVRRLGGGVGYVHRFGISAANDEERDSLDAFSPECAFSNLEGCPELASAALVEYAASLPDIDLKGLCKT